MGDRAGGPNRRWEATHERIADVALRLFRDEGYGQVSIARIADAAGVSVPTLYAHYPSKEHLVMPPLEPEQIIEMLNDHPPDRPLGTRIRLAAVSALLGFDADQRAQLLTRWRIIAGNPALRLRVGEFDRERAAVVAGFRAGGGPMRPAELVVAGAHLSALTSGLLRWADGDGRRDLGECLAEAFAALPAAAPSPADRRPPLPDGSEQPDPV
ncbi:TetR/AcrR family transcriptional regulator [Blastococcus sp. LR1]|uniref:TetR/AcrR family transcriptional regulator n=1 Tax=Blastococcus sp. LR1 TaxID=2877000 RepID=UPI001CC9187C|nr:TetR/AcrR family transcriptional regulator [Blastococcus sp. LR1]MCA0147012.1 TetR/AcrR family transcriptional regulator [Blastococcus sp. LR1]